MKKIIISLITLCLFACGTKGKNTNNKLQYNINERSIAMNNDSIVEIDTVLKIISELPEVIKLEQRYNIDGNKSIVLVECPNSNFNYFWVQVGVSTENRFEPIYNFYLTPKNHLIYFYDTENDTIITLADWQKLRTWQ
jgi:hypothetical protein